MSSNRDYAGLLTKIEDDILHICIPIPHVLQNVNLYLFLGKEPALIDAGPGHPVLERAVRGALRCAGVRRLSYIYLTHGHIDHFGLAGRIRRFTGAAVAAHRAEAPRIERVDRILPREYSCYASLSVALGFPEDMSRHIFAQARRWTEFSEPCSLDIKLRGGEELPAGDRRLEAVHTPGHTAGHLCYYDAEDMILFSGDHLMRSITPNPELYCPPRRGRITGLPQFIDSLELLERYAIKRAFPGHGQPIKQVRRRIEFNLLHHSRRLERTEEAVKEGCRTVWEVAVRLFPQVRGKPPEIDHFLALKEALGHLLILEEQGKVRREEKRGLWLYTPA